MKKNLFIYAALCALVVTGCSKQDEAETAQPEQGEAINITISATRHEAPSTRTEYEEGADKLIVKWNSDKKDQLGVFTNNDLTKNAPFAVDGALSADGKTAHFKGSLIASPPGQETTVYGYYPYSSTAGDKPEEIPIDLSGQKQDGISGEVSFAHLAGKDYMAATPVTKKFNSGDQNLSLEFNPLLTIMSFKITKAMDVESIKLEAVGESNKTPFYTDGAVNITTVDKSFPITGGTAQSSIKLDVTSGTIAAGATGMFNMMIFPMEPGNMPTQFKVAVTTTKGIVYVQTKPAPATGFERGKRYITLLEGLTKDDTPDVWDGTLPDANDDYPYSGGTGTASKPYWISTAKDLAQLAANVNAEFDSDNYFSLTKDINLNNKKWIPIGIYDGDYDRFKGTFDGNGYSVTGLSINSDKQSLGFFGSINAGTVKNLNVTGDITSNCNYGAVGGIAGDTYNSYIIGCSYSGSVKSTSYNARTGGICGSVSGYVIGCYNTSTVESTYTTSSAYCGGIAGNTNGANDGIIGCYNTGAVKGTESTRVGGIVASNQAKVKGCYNTGSVTRFAKGDTYCGGIFGTNSGDDIACLWVKSSAANTAIVGIATGANVGAGTIDPIADIATLNGNISILNTGIDAWNKDHTSGSQHCHFKFKAGADGNTPPTLTTEP